MTRPTVLIADDDESIRTSLARLARLRGFDVLLAEDGVEALAICRKQVPDIIVTDLHMPRLGGPKLVEMLRKMDTTREQPIMVVTADESRATKLKLLQSGADDFIVKPVDPGEFQARLTAQARRSDLAATLTVTQDELRKTNQKLEERTAELERLTFGLIEALEHANTMNDSDTGYHIRRVSEYSKLLAQRFGCDEDFVEDVYRYASLHDVGKVGIPDSILKKPGKLTNEEFDQMKTHTIIGADLIRAAGLPQTAINIPLAHHEKWDGTGYPLRLREEEISLPGRILGVVEVFDSLSTKRSYKDVWELPKTLAFFDAQRGRAFAPDVLDAFLELLEVHGEEWISAPQRDLEAAGLKLEE